MSSKRRVLIAPLDWGLGHAARCIPLIQKELEAGSEVMIAADESITSFLRPRFEQLEFIRLEGYRVKYHRGIPAWCSILLQGPSIRRSIHLEHRWLDDLLKHRQFDLVISDNRYGLWNRNVRCVIVTHQLFLRLPPFAGLFRKPVDVLLRRFIQRFDECWIPDKKEEPSLSGALSHRPSMHGNFRYIGWLSRFRENMSGSGGRSIPHFDTVVLLSGPEPRRTLLENRLVRNLKNTGKRILILQGIPQSAQRFESDDITFWPTATDEEMAFVLKKAERVICRPGYSTLMDLMTLGVKAELIPTPGQTEQEYLAKRMQTGYGWRIMEEDSL